jgi:hypothetical protein
MLTFKTTSGVGESSIAKARHSRNAVKFPFVLVLLLLLVLGFVATNRVRARATMMFLNDWPGNGRHS